MNRRQFIRKSGLAGAAVTLLPVAGLGSWVRPKLERIKLPECMGHVRHGEYGRMTSLELPGFPGIRAYAKDVFYANGFEPGRGDLINLRLESDTEQIGMAFLEGECFVSRNGTAFSMKGSSLQSDELLTDATVQLERFERKGQRVFQSGSAVVVITVIPPVRLDQQLMPAEEAIRIPAGQPFTLEGEAGSVYLILQGNH